MAYTITIGGTTRTTDVLTGSISITDAINDKANTCTFDLVDLSGSGIPSTDQEVIITLASGTVLFGGYIVSVQMTDRKSAGVIISRISCVDYVRLFDSNLVHKSYESMTDAAIIADIVSTYCAGLGITTTNVIADATIDQISFNYLQPSQVMRKLCDLTGNNWYIDYNKDIHYFPTTTNLAPFNITDTTLTQVNETMQSAPSGTLVGNATYDSTNKWVKLTPASVTQSGQLEYQKTLSDFGATFEFYNGTNVGSGGADAVYFYFGCSSSPVDEEGLGQGGYTITFDEYQDRIDLFFNGVQLQSYVYSTLDNGSFRTAKVQRTTTRIQVWMDGVSVLDYTDITRSLGGNYCGVGARTGGAVNEHRLKSLYISSSTTDYTDLKISKDASQLKNRIYVRGGTKLSDPTLYEEKGDGVKTVFVLPDKPHDVTVQVNGVTKTLGIKNVNLTGYDWYVNFQEKYVEQDAGGAVLTSGDTLSVTYSYDIPILVAQENTASIALYGTKEFAIFDKSITTTNAARDRAVAELTDYGNSIVEGSFSTHTDGFSSGQYINISLTAYGVSADYIIQNVSARSLGGGKFVYSVSIASAKTMGIIRFLIELLEANKNLIELDDNEVVDELFLITDSLLSDSITDALTIDSAGPYNTWATASESTPATVAKWDLFQWG